MSRLADYYIDHLLEPDMPIMHERRALRNVPEPYEYDVEREADWRRMQEWQWREECAKKEDERIERMMKEGGETVPCEQCGDWYWGPDPGAGDGLCPICYDNKNPSI